MTAERIIETLAPYLIVLSIRNFLKNISSKIGPATLINIKFSQISDELISVSTGFVISVWKMIPSADVIVSPMIFPIHINVNVIDK